MRGVVVGIVVLGWAGVGLGEEGNPFEVGVVDARPRIFVRDDEAFEGLTVGKLRAWIGSEEFRRAGAREDWEKRPPGRALLWMIEGREEDREAAVAGLKEMEAGEGSWSDRGLALVQMAALYDWLHEALDEPTRRLVRGRIERCADEAVVHLREGRAPFFYTRTPGALAGVAVAGLALHGESEKATVYLETFRRYGVGEYFRAYDWVDGAATGATYTLNYTFVDLPILCAAWWSATGRNPTEWIREQQGGWLDGMVRFYLWAMRPGFAFTNINDQFRGDWDTHDSFSQGLDLATYLTRDGHGRAWSLRWLGRFGGALYHPAYAHNLIFRDPTIPPKPLIELPHAELFGRESCGYGFFRSGWPGEGEPDTATHVFFRMGDPMDVHGGIAAGEFQIFKYAALADRGGRYSNYDSPPDQYHRNAISANVVLFTDPGVADDRGDQETRRGLKSDHATWDEWLAIRERNGHDVARIEEWRVTPGETRCRADLSRANPESKCRRWTRELVWLADRHLIVLDVVETARAGIRRTWQLHVPRAPEVGAGVIRVGNTAPDRSWAETGLKPPRTEGRLTCQTLLPRAYRVVVNRREGAEAFDAAGRPLGAVAGNRFHREYGNQVVELDPGTEAERTVFLNVLTASGADEGAGPEARLRVVRAGELEVSVGGASTRFEVPEWVGEAVETR